MSSTDSERLSALSKGGEHAMVTPGSEEFSVLDSFDLPEQALRDKVGYRHARPNRYFSCCHQCRSFYDDICSAHRMLLQVGGCTQ